MILIYPIFHTLKHELAHQRTFRGGLISTSRAIGISTIRILSVVIVRISRLEITMFYIESMVINHVKYHADSSLMKCLNHLFELTNAHFWTIGVSRITTFWHVIILWIIAPIVRRIRKLCFVNRSKIKHGQQVDSRHT